MPRAAIALSLTLAAALIGNPGAVSMCHAEPPIWPSWRGGDRQGSLPEGEYPIVWNGQTNQGILWRTAIPGHGYSSPVVDDQHIYLTTVSVAEHIGFAGSAIRWLSLIAAIACGALGVSQAVKSVLLRADAPDSRGWRGLRAAMILVIVSLALFFVLFGKSFGIEGAMRTRGWIAHAAAVLMLAAIGGAMLTPRTALRRAAVVILFILAVLVFWSTPRQSTTPQLEGSRALSTRMALATFAGVGAMAMGGWILAGRLAADPIGTPAASPNLLRFSIVALALLALLGGGALLSEVTKRLEFPGVEMAPISLQSWYSKHGLVAIAATMLGATVVELIAYRLSLKTTNVGLSAALVLCGLLPFVQFNWLTAQQRATRSIICFDRETGSVRWQCDGIHETVGQVTARNRLATPTPAVSHEHVVGYFGTAGLLCASKYGQIEWMRDDVPYESLYGVASSPLLIDDTVLVVSDGPADFSADGQGHLWAIDVRTGRDKWRIDWPAEKSFSGNSRTPCALKRASGTTILVWGWGWLRGVNLASGSELWKLPVPQPIIDQVASAVLDNERLLLTDQNGTRAWSLAALARGEVEELWENRRAKANCPTPCLVDGRLYTVTDGGVAMCLDAESGHALWRQRLEGEYYASVTGSSQHVYFTNTSGLTTVIKSGSTFEKLAESPVNQRTLASFAAFDGRLVLRGERELICVGAK